MKRECNDHVSIVVTETTHKDDHCTDISDQDFGAQVISNPGNKRIRVLEFMNSKKREKSLQVIGGDLFNQFHIISFNKLKQLN